MSDTPRPPLARDADPKGAAKADAARTPDCSHPAAGECRYLNCAFCGVWMIDGKVLQVAGRSIVDPAPGGP